MNFYLPTRDECQVLTQTSDTFYCSTKTIEGQVVEMYDYRLASHSDFFPEDGSNWTELRGLTFVQNPDGSWERNILLNKFFNYGQTIGWMPEDLDTKPVKRIQDKLDGSVISFIKFANGNIRAKSKMSFDSPQAIMAQEVFDNYTHLRYFVTECLNEGNTPIFELVSPQNQIVLEYANTDLVLLQVRTQSGSYLNPGVVLAYHGAPLRMATNFINTYSLQELLTLKEISQEPIEGWVVTFEDGQMCKIKTNRYLQLHGLIGPDAFRENLLVQTILDGNIDDIMSNLPAGPKRDLIVDITDKISSVFNQHVVDFKALRDLYFNHYNQDRKAFAIANKSHPVFSSLMATISRDYTESMAEEAAKTAILKQCNTLGKAQEYIKGL